jgi:hypothetical protein
MSMVTLFSTMHTYINDRFLGRFCVRYKKTYYGVLQHNMHFVYIYLYLYISVTVIRVGPPGHFTHISITTPIVPALKNYYI